MRARELGAGIASIAMLGGCASPPVTSGVTNRVACSADADCPQGFGCSSGTCLLTGATGPTGATAGGGAGATSGASGTALECRACTADADCGGGTSAGCWIVESGALFCGIDCTGNAGACPSGSTCAADSGDPYSTCVPRSGSCAGTSGVGSGAGSGASSSCTGLGDTWSNYARGFFAGNCEGCHGWAATYSGVTARSTTIQGYVSGGVMPPGGGLSSSEVQRVVRWLECGAPQ